jgi:hypothetical protein
LLEPLVDTVKLDHLVAAPFTGILIRVAPEEIRGTPPPSFGRFPGPLMKKYRPRKRWQLASGMPSARGEVTLRIYRDSGRIVAQNKGEWGITFVTAAAGGGRKSAEKQEDAGGITFAMEITKVIPH